MPVVDNLALVHFINGWLNTQAGLLHHHLLGLSQGHFDGIGVHGSIAARLHWPARLKELINNVSPAKIGPPAPRNCWKTVKFCNPLLVSVL